MTPLWRRIGIWASFAAATVCAAFGIYVLLQPSAGQGALSRSLQVTFFLSGLTAAFLFVCVALWLFFFHIRMVRFIGVLVFGTAAVITVFTAVQNEWLDWQDRRAYVRVAPLLDDLSDQYIGQLENLADDAGAARAFYSAYLVDHRAAQGGSNVMSEGDRQFRARWFLYYWTFHDPDFDGFTTYYPNDDDCRFVLRTWAARYAARGPVAVFVSLCPRP